MSHFIEYSKYYDLLYKDKDYHREVTYLTKIIENAGKQNCSLLDIGCGTGKHASLLSERGFKVHGVDISNTMLEEAIRHYGDKATFTFGDIRNLTLDKTFDVVTSLFHVISYQVLNIDLEASFQSVYDHLNPGGCFIFDCWYGPGVMNDPPSVRVKRMNDDSIEIIRIAEPEIRYTESVVDVNYQILINDLKTNHLTKLHEKHPMRFLFKNEIDLLAQRFRFKITGFYGWLTFNIPTRDDWYVVFVLQK